MGSARNDKADDRLGQRNDVNRPKKDQQTAAIVPDVLDDDGRPDLRGGQRQQRNRPDATSDGVNRNYRADLGEGNRQQRKQQRPESATMDAAPADTETQAPARPGSRYRAERAAYRQNISGEERNDRREETNDDNAAGGGKGPQPGRGRGRGGKVAPTEEELRYAGLHAMTGTPCANHWYLVHGVPVMRLLA